MDKRPQHSLAHYTPYKRMQLLVARPALTRRPRAAYQCIHRPQQDLYITFVVAAAKTRCRLEKPNSLYSSFNAQTSPSARADSNETAGAGASGSGSRPATFTTGRRSLNPDHRQSAQVVRECPSRQLFIAYVELGEHRLRRRARSPSAVVRLPASCPLPCTTTSAAG